MKQLFFDVIKPYAYSIAAIGFLAFYRGVYHSLEPYVLKRIIDQAFVFKENKPAILPAVSALVLGYILLWISIAIAMRCLDWVKLRLFPSIRYDLLTYMFSYLSGHSQRYFQNNFAGSLSNKISDMQNGAITIFTILEDGLFQCMGLSIAIVVLLLVHPIFALILFLWALGFIFIALCFFKSIHRLALLFAMSKTSLVGNLVDSIGNIINVRLFSRHSHESRLIQNAMQDTVTKDRAMQKAILKMRILWDLSIILLIGMNIHILVKMYSKNQVSVGDFSFIISLSLNIFYNLWFLASQFVLFSEELGKCKQALSLLVEGQEIVDRRDAKPLLITRARIYFDQVSFRYDQGPLLFNKVNLVIEAGEKVGLVGFSGSGKTTFVNLMLRFFELDSGQITIDGQSIHTVTQASLREKIAMVPQDIALFHRSLMDNIRYGRIDARDQEVIEASKKAHAHEFILQLAGGYQSLVGERGIKLSGGQRQRIAIARAILKNAPILILDEASSALDSVTEKQIQQGLHALMQGRTSVVIAHRLSTLSEMDRILVFDKGQIIEEGAHTELTRLGGRYAQMWQMQASGFLPECDLKHEP